MRVCFVIRSLNVGGAEKQLIKTASGLSELGHEVFIVTFYPNGSLEEEVPETVRLVSLKKRGKLHIVSFLIHAISVVRELKVDVLYGYLYGGGLIATLVGRALRRKVVWGLRSTNMSGGNYGLSYDILINLSKIIFKFADRLVVNSDSGKRYLRNDLGFAGLVDVIPNGIDTEKYIIDDKAGSSIRGKYGIGSGEYVVGIVGRLDPIKGHDIFIEAANILLKREHEIKFLVVGSGEQAYEQKLVGLVKELGIEESFIFGGSHNDMTSVYNALDLLVSTSLGESFQNTVAEAMSAGVSCVVSDVGDLRKIVGPFGDVVDAGNVDAFANAVEKRITHGITVAKEEVREHIVNNFSLKLMTDRTDEMLRKIVGG